MKKEVKEILITLGDLKKVKVLMPKKWFEDIKRRYDGKDWVKIDMKDMVNKIIKEKLK